MHKIIQVKCNNYYYQSDELNHIVFIVSRSYDEMVDFPNFSHIIEMAYWRPAHWVKADYR